MSVARVREINARLRAAGITVHEWPGWEARGNGQASAYEGGIDHHTATAFGKALPGTSIGNLLVNGRSDLAGPLCNHAGNDDGSITCIAAHPANHAGASGGRAMGPLPVTSLFNKRVLGLEIVYPGTVPMRPAQYRAALLWSRIVTDVCGYGDIQRARAHAETSITGKFDPGDAPSRTIDMAAFRAAALIALVGGDSMDPAGNVHDSALIERMHAFLQEKEVRTAGAASPENLPMVTNLKGMIGRVEALIKNQDTVTWGPTAGQPNLLARELAALRAEFAAIQVTGVTVDLDYERLAKAVNDDADQRARDNDPATGPRS